MGRDKGVRTRVRRAWGHWGREDAKERVPPEAGVQGQMKETWVVRRRRRRSKAEGGTRPAFGGEGQLERCPGGLGSIAQVCRGQSGREEGRRRHRVGGGARRPPSEPASMG